MISLFKTSSGVDGMRKSWLLYVSSVIAVRFFGDEITVILSDKGIKKIIHYDRSGGGVSGGDSRDSSIQVGNNVSSTLASNQVGTGNVNGIRDSTGTGNGNGTGRDSTTRDIGVQVGNGSINVRDSNGAGSSTRDSNGSSSRDSSIQVGNGNINTRDSNSNVNSIRDGSNQVSNGKTSRNTTQLTGGNTTNRNGNRDSSNRNSSSRNSSRNRDRDGERRGCWVIEVGSRMDGLKVEEVRRKVQSNGGRLVYVYDRIMRGISICGGELNRWQKVMLELGVEVVGIEPDKKYRSSYLQKGIPDNFYVSRMAESSWLGSGWWNRVVSKYVRNSYLVRKSFWFKWYRDMYVYAASLETGSGVSIHVLDTNGVFNHPEIEGRVRVKKVLGRNLPLDAHVVSVVTAAAGQTTGLGKEAQVYVYPVFDRSLGYLSDILWGLERVASEVVPWVSVVLLPFSGEVSDILDGALKHFFDRNVHVVAAAGNDSSNSCQFSPGRSAYALTVSSLTDTYQVSSWSNQGTCTDAYSPGLVTVGQTQTNSSTTTSTTPHYRQEEGTSLSAAYTAGYISQLIERTNYTSQALKTFFQSIPNQITPLPHQSSLFPTINSNHTYNSIIYDGLILILFLCLLLIPFYFLFKNRRYSFIRYNSRK
ncbi:hypothetical protein NEHOM01_0009 [Nematocida homosporus]|uniref:uncharacterized protein n=1 Tax=Nematocida homosporus TaxID=1912981 RepID=UPI00221EE885|nr:uncharacterized protein NEHOM01_0009 [Nematocida homosporus]KAI5184264.1 hypothetical protein NEHOM01_0009 [Nematocida homosporus]